MGPLKKKPDMKRPVIFIMSCKRALVRNRARVFGMQLAGVRGERCAVLSEPHPRLFSN